MVLMCFEIRLSQEGEISRPTARRKSSDCPLISAWSSYFDSLGAKVEKRFLLRSRTSESACSAWAAESREADNELFPSIRQRPALSATSQQQSNGKVETRLQTGQQTLWSLTLRTGGGGGGGGGLKALALKGRGSVSLGSVNNTHKTTAADVKHNSPFCFLVLCSKKRERRKCQMMNVFSETLAYVPRTMMQVGNST